MIIFINAILFSKINTIYDKNFYNGIKRKK